MKTEKKYYVEYTIGDSPRRGELVVANTLGTFVAKQKFISDIKNFTKPGTKVEIQSMTYKGTVLRIS